MKRRDLINKLHEIAKTKGEKLVITEGGKHSKATIGDWAEPIPRHKEINEQLAKAILKRAQK